MASIASFIFVLNLKFLRFGRAVHGHRFTGSHSFIAKDLRESRSGQKRRDTEFAGDDGAILISDVCVRLRFPT